MGNTTYYHRPNKMSKLIFNEQYHLLYCRIAKIGTTSWKLILLVLSGELNNTNADYSFRKLHDRKYPSVPLSSNDKQNYTSFLFVRHPFKRLLSAYRDKFETTLEPSFKKIERQIISQYRPNASMTGRNMAPKVSFLEFVKFLLNYKPKSNFNEHWDFQHKVCSLCDRSFDFIGHFENMEKESNYLLNYIGATDVFFPDHKYNFHVTNSTDENIYLKYFSQIPPKYIIKLYELYKMDFDLFGYSFPDELF
ncbi:carbohydrate sulfotransferase 11-like [Saccoglossus kowalevskii]